MKHETVEFYEGKCLRHSLFGKRLLMALMLMPLMTLAATDIKDGIVWSYTVVDGKARIGTGGCQASAIATSTKGAIVIPSSHGWFTVTSIGREAFYFCSGLTSVTMPSSVMSIGDAAFYACHGLTSVMIPSSVTNIAARAFYACSSPTSIAIPPSVMSIGVDAFTGTPFYSNQPIGMVILGEKVCERRRGVVRSQG